MQKVLVIGSQGYLGSRLIDHLLSYGYDCTSIDIGFFQYGVLYNPQSWLTKPKSAADIDSKDIAGHDVVILLAGISNDPFGRLDSSATYDPTRTYALKIARLCKEQGVRFVFPSSCSVYGIGGDGELTESDELNPQTGYSLNKVQIESDLSLLADTNFSPIALRLATVFGCSPRIRFDVVINMLCGMALTENRILLNSDGQAWRPHVYIDDVCEAFRCCIEWDYKGGNLLVLNVGRNDNNMRIIDIANLICDRLPSCSVDFLRSNELSVDNELVKDDKIQDGVDTRTYRVNFDLIHKRLPGFSASWNLADGIDQLLEDLQRYLLDPVKFKQRDFYRLHHLNYLSETNQLSSLL